MLAALAHAKNANAILSREDAREFVDAGISMYMTQTGEEKGDPHTTTSGGSLFSSGLMPGTPDSPKISGRSDICARLDLGLGLTPSGTQFRVATKK